MEVVERREAHHLLFQHLSLHADGDALQAADGRLKAYLSLRPEEWEGAAEEVFRGLAELAAEAALRRLKVSQGRGGAW